MVESEFAMQKSFCRSSSYRPVKEVFLKQQISAQNQPLKGLPHTEALSKSCFKKKTCNISSSLRRSMRCLSSMENL